MPAVEPIRPSERIAYDDAATAALVQTFRAALATRLLALRERWDLLDREQQEDVIRRHPGLQALRELLAELDVMPGTGP